MLNAVLLAAAKTVLCPRSMASLQIYSSISALFLSPSPLPLCSLLITGAAWQACSACSMQAADHHLNASLTGRSHSCPTLGSVPPLVPSDAAEALALQNSLHSLH